MTEQHLDNLSCVSKNSCCSNQEKLITAAHKNKVLQVLDDFLQNNSIACYKLTTLEQVIIHQCRLTDFASVEDYLDFLEDSEEEKANFCNRLIFPSTKFFNEPLAWKSLATNIIPQLLMKIPLEKEVRCWVIGCSRSEETSSAIFSG